MLKSCCKALTVIFLGMVISGCAGQKREYTKVDTGGLKSSTTNEMNTAQTNLDQYMEEHVNTFIVILDASGAKYEPFRGETKLKIAKDVLRGFNKNVPDRDITGALRRYGFEAGAFTKKTALLYDVDQYSRSEYANAIEKARWAGGKSPLALAINAASDDMVSTKGNLALIIVSDGKINEGNLLVSQQIAEMEKDPDKAKKIMKNDLELQSAIDLSAAAQATTDMKKRYADRLCIYTVQVGGLPYGKYLLEKIARIGQCGYAVNADILKPEESMTDWTDDVFTRRHRFAPERVAAGPCPDEDQDGVCDDRDRCPGTPKGAVVDQDGCWVLEPVQFDLNKWNIKPQYERILNDMISVLNLNPDLKVEVQGHTCTIWTEKYNMKLSHWRAMSVTSYLVKHGVDPMQLKVQGFGFKRPTASNDTEAGRIRNRRVEFKPLFKRQ